MIRHIVDQDFVQANPQLAIVGRASAQYAGQLMTLERYKAYREHEHTGAPAAADGASGRTSTTSISCFSLVFTVQGGYGPGIVRWNKRNMHPSITHPRFTYLCDDELVIDGLQADDDTFARELPFIMSPCQYTVGRRCLRRLLECARTDEDLAGEPVQCSFCSKNISRFSVRALEAGWKLA